MLHEVDQGGTRSVALSPSLQLKMVQKITRVVDEEKRDKGMDMDEKALVDGTCSGWSGRRCGNLFQGKNTPPLIHALDVWRSWLVNVLQRRVTTRCRQRRTPERHAVRIDF